MRPVRSSSPGAGCRAGGEIVSRWGWSAGWAAQARAPPVQRCRCPPQTARWEGSCKEHKVPRRWLLLVGVTESCSPAPTQSRQAPPTWFRCSSETHRAFPDTLPQEASPEPPWASGTTPPGQLWPPVGIWAWPFAAGVPGETGRAGEGSPAPTRLRLGTCSEGGLGGGLCGDGGSVRLLRSSAPVLWPVRARVALGAQGWGPWWPRGQRVLIVGSYL